ncbi:thermonuclease family protein [Bradyrhizobium sp. 180]|uniref:thermonuclease family protein n=1 Tax=unclassified Bradyrhizobium TaxID=2631580 RepID=UPI001FFA136D|nr:MULTISPECIES: thermonuclease family protein [unclassified Bradyrhizobium]MCK1419898.1 thermonuclease family protein [Bradyrhizobium sp. CW12]MCK1493329.1 thermonuclease family protein [Bradyrhizobium sp. 180]MCK1529568.1 thermonuclease family protein [Bradyrhizobium sp. 182]MCK1593688.1 thermonuclease family protein [Bradyrhizobium sp. 164]MCK1646161.1 thermonuclease family protein [Bradyrhizobium sp. 154]
MTEYEEASSRATTHELSLARNTTSPGHVTPRLHLIVALLLVAGHSASASPCQFESQGEGRVAAIVDARSVRLDDGREIRLIGIETTATTKQALTSLLAGRDVALRGTDDTPDRYGRQGAFVFVGESDISVQATLLAQGDAIVSAEITDKDCAAALMASEAEARRQKMGSWADPSAIKNAESPDDILAGIGRFMVVEGKVLSVRQAGAMTYLNFGRNWTRGFAATISRRTLPAFENAGITLKSLENRRIRVRGWVEGNTGPRIDIRLVGQVELLGANEPTGVRP